MKEVLEIIQIIIRQIQNQAQQSLIREVLVLNQIQIQNQMLMTIQILKIKRMIMMMTMEVALVEEHIYHKHMGEAFWFWRI
ncbi:hypothetical protein AAIB48_08080 [Paraclostridium benzoelyticum]|uniref:hypothetical protein n=1 Tax=Paraclostridium benzoelyticum TaxID=1629550 RepID=UPI0031CCE51C